MTHTERWGAALSGLQVDFPETHRKWGSCNPIDLYDCRVVKQVPKVRLGVCGAGLLLLARLVTVPGGRGHSAARPRRAGGVPFACGDVPLLSARVLAWPLPPAGQGAPQAAAASWPGAF